MATRLPANYRKSKNNARPGAVKGICALPTLFAEGFVSTLGVKVVDIEGIRFGDANFHMDGRRGASDYMSQMHQRG